MTATDTHFGLMTHMAERAGLDLPALARDRHLSPADVEVLVDRCSQCRDVGGCVKVLAREESQVPGWCMNADAFRTLGDT